ncbi:hypothetical protein DFP72DRAFT_1082027 [Ephemerocybe angulata]|uniref:Uncharacterized protein n=1 Tax=Ephemerocybe angulata TaxID=980116 RepID=A0A8H6HAR3_9AGAR|nr:hypothetical protein DFP72DRAFT_1082027 [Tulosesus angulatus]
MEGDCDVLELAADEAELGSILDIAPPPLSPDPAYISPSRLSVLIFLRLELALLPLPNPRPLRLPVGPVQLQLQLHLRWTNSSPPAPSGSMPCCFSRRSLSSLLRVTLDIEDNDVWERFKFGLGRGRCGLGEFSDDGRRKRCCVGIGRNTSGITLDFSSSSFDTRDPLDHIILATQLHWHGLPPREIELEERNRLVFFLFALVLPLLKFESIDTLSASESDSNASPAYLAMLLGCGSSFQQVGRENQMRTGGRDRDREGAGSGEVITGVAAVWEIIAR